MNNDDVCSRFCNGGRPIIVICMVNGFLFEKEKLFITMREVLEYVRELKIKIPWVAKMFSSESSHFDGGDWVNFVQDTQDQVYNNHELKAKIIVAYRKLVRI